LSELFFAALLLLSSDLWQSTNCVGETPDEHFESNIEALAGSHRPPGVLFRSLLIGLSTLSCASGTQFNF
jgi:hypothetical protein